MSLISHEQQPGRAALYCRVASSSPSDAGAIGMQQETLRGFARSQGFNEITEYLDDGYSGNTLDRPAFAQMDADISAGKIDTVIVRSVDRVARNTLLVDNWITSLRARSANIIAMDGSLEPPAFFTDIMSVLMRNRQRKGGGRYREKRV